MRDEKNTQLKTPRISDNYDMQNNRTLKMTFSGHDNQQVYQVALTHKKRCNTMIMNLVDRRTTS